MRKIWIGKAVVALAIALYAGAALSASFDLAAPPPNVTPVPVPVQGYGYYGGYPAGAWANERFYFSGWRPVCPYRHHWECWGPYGAPACGCRPDPGLYTGY